MRAAPGATAALAIVLQQSFFTCEAFAPPHYSLRGDATIAASGTCNGRQMRARVAAPLQAFGLGRETFDFEEMLGLKTQGYKDITVVQAVQVNVP